MRINSPHIYCVFCFVLCAAARFELRAAAAVRGVRELQQPGGGDGGGGVAAAGVHRRGGGPAGRQPGAVPADLLHRRLLHRRHPDRTGRLQVRNS